MNIGIIGSGEVAKALAKGFVKHGYRVTIGTRTPEKMLDFVAANGGIHVADVTSAAKFGDLVVLAVKGTAAVDAVAAVALELANKVVIDTSNPIADVAPENGVLQYFTGGNDSLGERLQNAYPEIRFVKAFNSVGSAFMVNPQFVGGRPTMFIAGNDEQSKRLVSDVLDQFGWEVADMGGILSARAIEPLCRLWCLPGLLRNEWGHAFKLMYSA